MIADIILILVILLCIFIGYKRGLIKVAVRIFSFVIALVIALILYTPISNYIIENTEIVTNLKNVIASKLYSKEEQIEDTNKDTGMIETMGNYINGYTEDIKENTSEFIAEELAIAGVRVGTWVLLFIGIKLLTLFIKIFADTIANIPIIKQFNKARWYNIWYFRRSCYCICFSCHN